MRSASRLLLRRSFGIQYPRLEGLQGGKPDGLPSANVSMELASLSLELRGIEAEGPTLCASVPNPVVTGRALA